LTDLFFDAVNPLTAENPAYKVTEKDEGREGQWRERGQIIEEYRMNPVIRPYVEQFGKKTVQSQNHSLLAPTNEKPGHALKDLLQLKSRWSKGGELSQLTNTNFWLYHLEEYIKQITKRDLSLYDFQYANTFYSNNLMIRE